MQFSNFKIVHWSLGSIWRINSSYFQKLGGIESQTQIPNSRRYFWTANFFYFSDQGWNKFTISLIVIVTQFFQYFCSLTPIYLKGILNHKFQKLLINYCKSLLKLPKLVFSVGKKALNFLTFLKKEIVTPRLLTFWRRRVFFNQKVSFTIIALDHCSKLSWRKFFCKICEKIDFPSFLLNSL